MGKLSRSSPFLVPLLPPRSCSRCRPPQTSPLSLNYRADLRLGLGARYQSLAVLLLGGRNLELCNVTFTHPTKLKGKGEDIRTEGLEHWAGPLPGATDCRVSGRFLHCLYWPTHFQRLMNRGSILSNSRQSERCRSPRTENCAMLRAFSCRCAPRRTPPDTECVTHIGQEKRESRVSTALSTVRGLCMRTRPCVSFITGRLKWCR